MAIADKITSMANHLTADYDAIESVVGEVTVDKNIENIAPLLDNLWEELPHTTASGTALAINDTRTGKMKVQLMGNTSQTQKTGKNLLNIQTSSSSQFGITVTKNSDGTLTVNGTATADAAVIFNTTVTLAAGTYTLSGCPSGGSSSTYNLNLDQLSTMRDNGSGVTFTLNSERTSTAYVSVKSGVTLNNVIFKPMIVSGSTSGDFEPYNGKKATPNPDNPEQVHTCSGDNEVVVSGINVWDEEWEQGTLNASTGALITINTRIRSKNFIPVFSNTNYYYTIPSIASNCLVVYYDGNNNYISSVYVYSGNYLKTTPANCKYIKISPDATYGATYNNDICINVSDVNINGTYYPYTGASYPIHLGTYELCKIGTYQDKFIRNSGKNLFDESYYNNATLYTQKTPYFASLKLPDSFKTKFYGNMNLKGTSQSLVFGFSNSNNSVSTRMLSGGTITNNVEYDFTNATNVYLVIGNSNGINISTDIPKIFNNYNIMISKTSGDTYEPYGNGEWYLEKYIGKVVLDGSETGWSAEGQRYRLENIFYAKPMSSFDANTPLAYSDYFKWGNGEANNFVYGAFWYILSGRALSFQKDGNPNATTLADFKIWLSNNNTPVYYVLATPTYTKIEGTLKDELEAVWRAYSYNEQTNVTQSNNDLPFELSITALEG